MGKAEILARAEDNTKLVVFKDVQPIFLLESDTLDQMLADIKTEVLAEINDVNTEDGRKNIKELGSKIGKSLRFVEKAALDHARELKSTAKIFDGKRKIFKDFMSALQDNTMRQLEEYEENKKAHALAISDKVCKLMIAGVNGVLVDGVDTLEGALAWKKKALETVIDESFEGQQDGAEQFRQQSLLIVDGLIAKYEKEAQEAAESEKARLKMEEEALRLRDERVAREATEKAELATQEAIEAEKRKAEQSRIDAERREKEAEAQAIIDKENAVKAEAARVQKIADDKTHAENVRVTKLAEAEATKKAEEEKKANSQKHRNKVRQNIKDAVALAGLGADAFELVKLIDEGKIPNITINY